MPLLLLWMLSPKVKPWITGPGIVMVSYVSLLHLLWAIMLLRSSTPLGATPLSMISHMTVGHSGSAALLLLLASVAAFPGIYHAATRWWVLLLPQQGLLLLSAWGGVSAWWLGRYADGTVIASAHILADQLGYLLMAGFYGLAVLVSHTVAVTEREISRRLRVPPVPIPP